uniref:Alpha-ribazole phosphatase/probable phosphoglycerate mutase n=1 Tax=Candidatus Kentrum sp. FM TaxID=2126340 RepID=A0A450RX14_9GAMM|nr:MAG: alpha-ribazole phosphatase/probable phosphoglycerate mutase [Candidatus Kentron sp. FM]VFJ68683.1 MAG: alpha-ribazole phosphatase/probable phosphoglycerate mutase [Candidatus Kentron sp. FM]VFK10436.1 MAG: alpha-ribazole phosphatase/probable phosphoglycerate mutase [Candidatus Kentron sp. FM]
MRSKIILLIRHGEAIQGKDRGGENWEHRPYIGKTDPSLTQTGIVQAKQLVERLIPWVYTKAPMGESVPKTIAVLSSPARRALETARLATSGLGTRGTELPIQQDPDLWEIDFGRWEGKCFPQIKAMDAVLVDEWAQGRMDFRFPEGESLSAFRARVIRAGDRMRHHRAQVLLVITHGGVIRFLICYLLGLPPSSHLAFQIGTGSIARIHCYDGGAVLGL